MFSLSVPAGMSDLHCEDTTKKYPFPSSWKSGYEDLETNVNCPCNMWNHDILIDYQRLATMRPCPQTNLSDCQKMRSCGNLLVASGNSSNLDFFSDALLRSSPFRANNPVCSGGC